MAVLMQEVGSNDFEKLPVPPPEWTCRWYDLPTVPIL